MFRASATIQRISDKSNRVIRVKAFGENNRTARANLETKVNDIYGDDVKFLTRVLVRATRN